MPNQFKNYNSFPGWQDYIKSDKIQALIMAKMCDFAYLGKFNIKSATLDENNNFIKLGTMIFFDADGQYKVIQPEDNSERIVISVDGGNSTTSKYFNYPIPAEKNYKIEKIDYETNTIKINKTYEHF